MLRSSMMKEDSKKLKQTITTKYVVSEPVAIDGTKLIPVSLGGRLMPVPIPINELGKQLLKAAGDGNKDEIKKLMSQGAPFTADWLGTSPLHIAAQNNHLEICEILLRAGISRDARTKVDRTPLHMAAYEGHLEIVETLLKHGADYDCRDLLQMTPLHWAAQNGHLDVANLLIKYGATTDLKNKFDLTPTDIAEQINRQDIVEAIKLGVRDPSVAVATDQLALELGDSSNDSAAENSYKNMHDESNSPIPVDTVLMEDDSENSNMETERSETANLTILDDNSDNQDTSLTESLKLLEQHGITMLQNDESSILSSAMESGRSVVLTDVGKEVLNSVKMMESTTVVPPAAAVPKIISHPIERRKIITVTPEQFLSLASNGNLNRPSNILQQINGKVVQNVKPTVKRIVMKKSKIGPVSVTPNVAKVQKIEAPITDMETVMKQLIDARKLIEEYKEKLRKKEAEAEHYKQQLKRVLGTK